MQRYYCLCLLVAITTSCGEVTGDPPSPNVQLRSFGIALRTFREDFGRYPTSAEGLRALVIPPAGSEGSQWKGPYLDASDIPLDRWGHAYMYRSPDGKSTNQFALYSMGPDGQSKTGGGDADDVNYWELRPRPEHR